MLPEPVICQSDFSSFPLLQCLKCSVRGFSFSSPPYCLKTNSWLVSFSRISHFILLFFYFSPGGVGCNVRPYGVRNRPLGTLRVKKKTKKKQKNSIFLAMVRRWCFGSANAESGPISAAPKSCCGKSSVAATSFSGGSASKKLNCTFSKVVFSFVKFIVQTCRLLL